MEQTAQLPTSTLPEAPAAAAPTRESILFVDDDAHVLEAFERQFRKTFDVHVALGPDKGLEAMEKNDYAVVVSDLRMPWMNGIQFLAAVRSHWPDTVRIMLTGHGDMQDAVAAVNQGSIFRFLVKPCTPTILMQVIKAGVEQHRLSIAERQLTEQTLLGTIELLVEVLSVVQPNAFQRASRVRRYIRCLAQTLGVEQPWQFEAAAMLSHIGWITLSPDLAEKAAAQLPMSAEESARFVGHASAAARMLEKIPRLGLVASIIEGQYADFKALKGAPGGGMGQPITLGAQMLRCVMDFDALRASGCSHQEALQTMRALPDVYNPDLVQALTAIEKFELLEETRIVALRDLTVGMSLEEPLYTSQGLCLIGKGQEITAAMLERLSSFSHMMGLDQTVRVRIRNSNLISEKPRS